MFQIVVSDEKRLQRDLRNLPEKDRARIIGKIKFLAKDPFKNSQSKELQHYELADYRLRVGNYRVLFDVDTENKTIILYRVLHRSKLY